MKHFNLRTMISLVLLSAALIVPASEASAGESAAESLPSFILEGKEYTLPLDYAVLEKDGWITSDNVDYELDDNTVTLVYMRREGTEDDTEICFSVYNGSGSTKKIRDCQVSKVSLSEQYLEWYSFEFSNGIKPGDDMETVKRVMGDPDKIDVNDSSTIYYYGDENRGGEITFTWYNDDLEYYEGCDSMAIEYYQRAE